MQHCDDDDNEDDRVEEEVDVEDDRVCCRGNIVNDPQGKDTSTCC